MYGLGLRRTVSDVGLRDGWVGEILGAGCNGNHFGRLGNQSSGPASGTSGDRNRN